MPPLTNPEQKWAAWLRWAALAAALGHVVMFLVIALLRLGYPFELEWMEGGMLQHVQRILDGHALYVAPSVEFVPFVYTPLYHYMAAGLAAVMGVSFIPLRLLSIAAAFGCFLLIYRLVQRETGRRTAGILAAGFFAATYRFTGAWFDIARVDSLFLLLLLGTVYVLRFRSSIAGLVLAGLLLSLSFLTKQSALLAVFPLGLYALVTQRARGLWFIGTVAGALVLSTVILDALHDGWYSRYVLAIPSSHGLEPRHWLSFWTHQLGELPVAVALGGFYLLGRFFERRSRDLWFYGLMVIALFATGGASWVKAGAFWNDLMPSCAAIAIGFGLGLQILSETAEVRKDDSSFIPHPSSYRPWVVLPPLLAFVQLTALIYEPAKHLPTSADERAGFQVVEKLRHFPGNVFIPFHSYLAAAAGKHSFTHIMGAVDIMTSRNERAKRAFLEDLRRVVREHHFSAIILDGEPEPFWEQAQLANYYEKRGRLLDDETVFWPVTGYAARPEWIWVAREIPRAGE